MGKTTLAVEICRRTGGEIVSIDSRQVFQGIEVISNAPTAEELGGVACNLVGVVDPAASMTAAAYVEMVRPVLARLRRQRVTTVLTCGTGLYLKALLEGFDLGGSPADPSLRRQLEAEAERDLAALVRRLKKINPGGIAGLDVRNPVRVVRRMEVALLRQRQPEPRSRRKKPPEQIAAVKIGLNAPRQELDRWIEERVDRMLAHRWRDEVAALLAQAIDPGSQAFAGIGVAEMAAHIRGELDIAGMRAAVIRRTRAYAKRQLTWFRADPEVRWFDVTAVTRGDIVEAVLEML